MNKIKRIVVFLLAVSFVLLCAGCSVSETAETEAFQEITEIPKLPTFIPKPEKTVSDLDLPSAYNIEETRMPGLRDQGDTNGCWAFASLSALEASNDEDGMGPYSADHLMYQNPFHMQFENGGSYIVTMAYVLSWMGPVTEEMDPFDGVSPEKFDPCVHVQEIRLSQPKDYETIKRFVYLYGGVESALYMDFEDSVSESAYYDSDKKSFCYTGSEISNHDIVIVGWDDEYPAENFVGEITTDGAFLCQNSWGESFGDHGIFYVSYEDVNIGGYGVAYSRVDAADNYDRIFQSDLCGFTAQIGYNQESCWFANAYTAEEDLLVKAAGFYATGEFTEYEIYIVNEFDGKSSFKEKRYICNGFVEDAGYYTIDFPKAQEVEAGSDFAIVVKIVTEDASHPVAIEYPTDEFPNQIDISDGKGYLSLQGKYWVNVEETNHYNICLKAYADLQ